LRPLITSPLIEVGEFTYYDDPLGTVDELAAAAPERS